MNDQTRSDRLSLAAWPLSALLLVALLGGDGAVAQITSPRFPSPQWANAEASELGVDAQQLEQAKRYALSAGGSGMIVLEGTAIMRWGDQEKLYDVKSATKSFGATMLGVAVKEGKITLDAPARTYHPTLGVPPNSNLNAGWVDDITVIQLATQTAGFDKPGGYEPLLFEPGSHWHYSDGGPNWLAECITLQYGIDLEELMFDRVFTPIGIEPDDLRWRKNQYRDPEIDGIPRREFGSGIHTNVDALARLGYLYLREGRWRDRRILAAEFIKLATETPNDLVGLPEWDAADQGNASDHYGLLWWNNADGALPGVPRDAYWAWGLFDSLIVVVPSLDLVVVRAGEQGRQLPRTEGAAHYDVLRPLLEPIVKAVEAQQRAVEADDAQDNRQSNQAPHPASALITGIEWAPKESIIRRAEGSDNWPITWADDDRLYTAYGDGWGFMPQVEKKLSLGLAVVSGSADDFRGQNLRSASAEHVGQGADGLKASGMLMVDGVLYMLVRNADHAQLAWSADHGKTWQWSDWKWTTSFGCPTFLNFGQNYAGARDDDVYIYSPDSDGAYEPADRMVLARVPSDSLRQRDAYEFFQGLEPESRTAAVAPGANSPERRGHPIWTKDIDRRGAVFAHAGHCYRSGISYNAGIERFLWCHTLPTSEHPQGPRFQGGLAVYEAPEPWGPWRTVEYNEDWDVGPGETSRFPTKWMSPDGRTLHLLFSGGDCFSVRQATLQIATDRE